MIFKLALFKATLMLVMLLQVRSSMKLLTLNCHSWQEHDQQAKINILAQTIIERDYDVIALQEVSQHKDAMLISGTIRVDNFADILIKELHSLGNKSYQFYWSYAHIGYGVFEEGLALVTKHPIIESSSYFISKGHDQTFWKTRTTSFIKINYNNRPIYFHSCHLGWWTDEQEPFKIQVDNLLSQSENHELVFFMGDFNNDASVRNEGYDYLMSKGLYDTYKLSKDSDAGLTVQGKIDGWDQNKKGMRLDLILVNQPVKVISSTVIFNKENKPIVSDHFGVEVEVDLSYRSSAYDGANRRYEDSLYF